MTSVIWGWRIIRWQPLRAKRAQKETEMHRVLVPRCVWEDLLTSQVLQERPLEDWDWRETGKQPKCLKAAIRKMEISKTAQGDDLVCCSESRLDGGWKSSLRLMKRKNRLRTGVEPHQQFYSLIIIPWTMDDIHQGWSNHRCARQKPVGSTRGLHVGEFREPAFRLYLVSVSKDFFWNLWTLDETPTSQHSLRYWD